MADPDPMTCDPGSWVYDPDPRTVIPDPIYLVTTLTLASQKCLSFITWLEEWYKKCFPFQTENRSSLENQLSLICSRFFA